MPESNNVVDLLKGVVGELKDVAKSETIIGDPVTVGNRTVIPVVKISFGFGAGGGQGEANGQQKGTGFGGGGGGGAKIEPAAFILIDGDEIKVVPAGKHKWEQVIEAVPGIAKKISKMVHDLKKGDSGGDDDGGGDSGSESDEGPRVD